jgi:hypothetical protein
LLRRGGGPKELRGFGGLFMPGGDLAFVYDMLGKRWFAVESDGRIVRTTRLSQDPSLDQARSVAPYTMRTVPWVEVATDNLNAREWAPTGSWVFLLEERSGEIVARVGPFETQPAYLSDRVVAEPKYRSEPWVVRGSGVLAVAEDLGGGRGRVRIFSSENGEELRSFPLRRGFEMAPDWYPDYVASMTEPTDLRAEFRSAYREMFAQLPEPTHLPPFSEIRLTEGGILWAFNDWSPVIDGYDAESGEYLGSLQLPEPSGKRILSVTDRWVVTVQSNEHHLSVVKVFEIDRH